MRQMWVIKFDPDRYYCKGGTGMTHNITRAHLYAEDPGDDSIWWDKNKCRAVRVRVTVEEEE